jgi:arginase family enzyme
VDVPAPGGWDVARLEEEMSAIAATGRLAALSLCCGNPRRDIDGQSTRAYLAGLEALLR